MDKTNVMDMDNETVTISLPEISYIECCDCGLVHRVEHEINGESVACSLFNWS